MDFKTNSKSGIAYYTSGKLGTGNAFLTRCGGISEKYGLNLAYKRGDSDETVRENLRIVAKEFGFSAEDVVSCPQIHSAKILTVKEEDKGLGYFKESEAYDGYVTDKSGIVLAVKTADCTPILLSAKRNGSVIAVGAVHAGWRGTVLRIAENAVKAMTDIGVKPNEIFAAIGPSAGKCCYEVGEEVLEAAEKAIGNAAERYFRPNAKGTLTADIKGINAYILHECGVPYENTEISDACTICEGRYFYSHRRDGENRGTHLNLIWMK